MWKERNVWQERHVSVDITWLSRPSMSNIKKKRAAQSGAKGIKVTALG